MTTAMRDKPVGSVEAGNSSSLGVPASTRPDDQRGIRQDTFQVATYGKGHITVDGVVATIRGIRFGFDQIENRPVPIRDGAGWKATELRTGLAVGHGTHQHLGDAIEAAGNWIRKLGGPGPTRDTIEANLRRQASNRKKAS